MRKPERLVRVLVVVGVFGALVASLAVWGLGTTGGTRLTVAATAGSAAAGAEASPGVGPTTSTAPTTTAAPPPRAPSVTTAMSQAFRVTGDISPKSVVASGHGLVFAQNMMYKHTVTAYAPDGTLEATIADSVDLATFGISDHPGTSQGAPVEAVFTNDGRYAYVSNYAMYGKGFGPEGTDSCSPSSGYDDSFV
jgi:hypothetical protein